LGAKIISSRAAADLPEAMSQGIEACRKGAWNLGLPILARIAEDEQRSAALPALVYSYLGYGVALRQQRIEEGLRLCLHAVKLEFYQAESYLNLARTQLLAHNRQAAIRAVKAGLKIEKDNEALLELYRELGMRRGVVLPFLSRSNPINLALGRLRHAFSRQG
jgi:tetratricopeptide (TPR) repeat protein